MQLKRVSTDFNYMVLDDLGEPLRRFVSKDDAKYHAERLSGSKVVKIDHSYWLSQQEDAPY